MKFRKTLYIRVLTVFLALCFGVLAACGETEQPEPSNAVTYSVTVLYPDGTPVEGVKVKWDSYSPKTTDANGQASISLEADEYEITLSNLPNGYTYTPVTATSADRGVTITLTAENEAVQENSAYTITVLDPDGEPLENVTVSLSTSSATVCLPAKTDAQGKAVCEVEAGVYYVQLSGYPEEYVYDVSTAVTKANGDSVTVQLSPLNVLDYTDKTTLTSDEKSALNLSYSYDCYAFNVSLTANELAYFAVKVPLTGEYILFLRNAVGTVNGITYSSNSFDSQQSLNYFGATTIGQSISCTANILSYFTMDSTKDEELTVILACPEIVPTVSVTETGTYEITISAEYGYAEIAFKPNEAGVYSLASDTDDYDPKIAYYPFGRSSWDNVPDSYKDDNGGDGNNFYFEVSITESELFDESGDKSGNVWYFHIFLNDELAENESALIKLIVTREGDVYEKQRVVQYIKAETPLSQFREYDGTLTSLRLNSASVIVYNQTDGFYHVGDVNGPVLVVSLTKAVTDYYDVPLVELDKAGTSGTPFRFNVTPAENLNDISLPYVFNDYSIMLRGFKNYSYSYSGSTLVPTEPEPETDNYYSKYVNSDGVYGVTEELREFLELFAAANQNWIQSCTSDVTESDYLWLFACAYYA